MIEKVREYIKQYNMLTPGDTVVAGVSGGADSLCLLFMLKELQEELNLRLAVVHVNHGIREEAGRDAEYVEQICEKLKVPFFLKEADVGKIAKSQGISAEEAGRNVRYAAFEEILGQLIDKASKAADGDGSGALPMGREKSGKIAVAHNANDRAETMLFHLFRGTGLTGLSGIKPVRERIIRPLLCLDRQEIEQYLEKKEITFCIDRTNNEDTYTRNKIRHHILPFAEENICTGSVNHMNQTAEMLLETEEFLKKQASAAFSAVAVREENGITISVKDFKEQPGLMQKRVLLLCMEILAAGRRDIGLVHIEDMLALFTKEGNKEQALPYGIKARREFDRVYIGKETREQTELLEKKIPIPGEVEIEGLGVLEASIFEYDKSKIIPEKTYTKWFDYDKIEKSLVLRTRQTGDYLTINEALSKKTLKKYFIEEKISKNNRDSLYVAADGNHIVWIPGYRISHYYKVSAETKNILQLHLRGGNEMAEHIRVLLPEEEVNKRIKEIGAQISKDYAGKEVHLVCVLKGGSFFMCELAKRITIPVSFDFMSVSSYGSETKSSGVVKIVKDLDEPLEGKEVIIVEDIVDSGRTLSYLMEILEKRGPKSLKICTMLDKPERRVADVEVNYTGFEIPDEFVVGYGLDYDQKYRNLPYIGVVEFD